MYIEQDKLKMFLKDAGLVSDQALEDATDAVKAEKYETIGAYLVKEGKVSDDDLKRIQAYILGVPFIDLSTQKIDLDVLAIIPEPIARNHNIVAFNKVGNKLEVAMLDTDDISAIEFIKKKTGYSIQARLTSTDSIKNALIQYQKSLKADFGDIIKKESGELKVVTDGNDASEQDLKKIAEDLPVIRIVDTLLKHAILQSASDIHVEPQENALTVRYRVDGILHEAMTLPKQSVLSITARIKVLANLKLDEKRLPQDGRFKIELDGEKVAFRVSILPTYYGEKTVMRVLREGGGGFTLESLGFHGDGLERIHDAMKQTTGLILTTGPTGSGKSTTLYTLLDLLNTPDVNISTVEDPVEYQMKRVNQTQVRPQIGFTFAEGLRSLVRQDPDIIMVGEIRDGETAGLAVNAALTGHLVLSTLHTNSAAGTLPRLTDMGAERFLLVSTLRVIIGQRLVRKLGKSVEKYNLTKAGIKSLQANVNLDRVLEELKKEKIVEEKATWETIPFYRPKKKAENDGYKGRIGIHEILTITPAIQELIIAGKSAEKIEEQAQKEGMMTMIEDGIFKAVQGRTTIEEVLRVISE
jgi:type IV pilus assembly protein PilB